MKKYLNILCVFGLLSANQTSSTQDMQDTQEYTQNQEYNQDNISEIDRQIQQYQELLRKNGLDPILLYPKSDYLEDRFKNADKEKKQQLSKYYSYADRKKGAFGSVMLGFGSIQNSYADGTYNRANNVPANDGNSICTDTDKSGCQITGLFNSSFANPLNIQSNLISFGGGFGYQSFFNPYFGSRIYGDGLISAGSEKINGTKVGELFYILGGMNADLLFDLPFRLFTQQRFWKKFTIGTYIGLNIGVMLLFDSPDTSGNIKQFMKSDKQQYSSEDVLWKYQLQVDYGFNLGFNITFLERDKIEIGAKIPMNYIGLPSELRLGIEKPASYAIKDNNGNVVSQQTLVSKDITFTRTPILIVSYVHLF